MLLGGWPELRAAAFGLLGFYLLQVAVACGLLALKYALDGTMAALLPIPFGFAAAVLAWFALRESGSLIGALRR